MRKQGEHAQTIAIEKLVPFRAHPFVVRDDDQMRLLTESISSMGILTPAIARPLEDGTYELIAGHRRKHACELLEIPSMPVIVRDISDDAATVMMVDSNLQREVILPSEKAKAYKMKLDALKRQERRSRRKRRIFPTCRTTPGAAGGHENRLTIAFFMIAAISFGVLSTSCVSQT